MATPLKIDFVSDVSCPWCAIGLAALEQALDRVKGEVQAELHFQPFELNPQMGAQGQDVAEHLTQKYGSTPCAAGTDPRHHPRARRGRGL
jgi:predicted DsbA family dithiol-disulfide isomerase